MKTKLTPQEAATRWLHWNLYCRHRIEGCIFRESEGDVSDFMAHGVLVCQLFTDGIESYQIRAASWTQLCVRVKALIPEMTGGGDELPPFPIDRPEKPKRKRRWR